MTVEIFSVVLWFLKTFESSIDNKQDCFYSFHCVIVCSLLMLSSIQGELSIHVLRLFFLGLSLQGKYTIQDYIDNHSSWRCYCVVIEIKVMKLIKGKLHHLFILLMLRDTFFPPNWFSSNSISLITLNVELKLSPL